MLSRGQILKNRIKVFQHPFALQRVELYRSRSGASTPPNTNSSAWRWRAARARVRKRTSGLAENARTRARRGDGVPREHAVTQHAGHAPPHAPCTVWPPSRPPSQPLACRGSCRQRRPSRPGNGSPGRLALELHWFSPPRRPQGGAPPCRGVRLGRERAAKSAPPGTGEWKFPPRAAARRFCRYVGAARRPGRERGAGGDAMAATRRLGVARGLPVGEGRGSGRALPAARLPGERTGVGLRSGCTAFPVPRSRGSRVSPCVEAGIAVTARPQAAGTQSSGSHLRDGKTEPPPPALWRGAVLCSSGCLPAKVTVENTVSR